MALTGAFNRSTGLSRDIFSSFEASPSQTQSRTAAEMLGFKTTRANLPQINTDNMKTANGVNAAVTSGMKAQASANIGACRADVQNFTASFSQQHQIAMNEATAAAKGVANEMGISANAAMASISSQGTTDAAVVAGMIGGMGATSANMVLDTIVDTKKLGSAQKSEFISKLCDNLAQQASHARQQVALGIVPEGAQKPVMKWDEIDEPKLEEFLQTSLENQPEMIEARQLEAVLDEMEAQLQLADVETGLRVYGDDENYLATADVDLAQEVDAACVLTEVEFMSESLPYAGLDHIVCGHEMQIDPFDRQKIESTISAKPVQAATLPEQSNAMGFHGPKLVAADGRDGDSAQAV